MTLSLTDWERLQGRTIGECPTCGPYKAAPSMLHVCRPVQPIPPAPSIPVRMESTDIPCVHRGPQVAAAQCRPCSGQTYDVAVYSCAVRARCTISRYKPGQKEVCCMTCKDRVAPAGQPDPFSEIFGK